MNEPTETTPLIETLCLFPCSAEDMARETGKPVWECMELMTEMKKAGHIIIKRISEPVPPQCRTHSLTKRSSKALIADFVRRMGKASSGDVAAHLRVTRYRATVLLLELEREGVIHCSGFEGRGKKSNLKMYYCNPDNEEYNLLERPMDEAEMWTAAHHRIWDMATHHAVRIRETLVETA